MASIVATCHIAQALYAKLPPSAIFPISSGDAVRIFRERESLWEGLLKVARLVGKQSWMDEARGW